MIAITLPQVHDHSTEAAIAKPCDIHAEIVANYPDLLGGAQEGFVLFVLNSQNRILKHKLVALGGAAECHVDAKILFHTALTTVGATGFAVAHNHPSGVLEPSRADIALTKQLASGGELLCLKLVDHLIFHGCRFVSFAQDWR
jgi:DNA repair protein RadC